MGETQDRPFQISFNQHARYYWLLLAEGHLTRRLFGNMLQKIAALPSPAGESERKRSKSR